MGSGLLMSRYSRIQRQRHPNPHKILNDDEKRLLLELSRRAGSIKEDSMFSSICWKLGINGKELNKKDEKRIQK